MMVKSIFPSLYYVAPIASAPVKSGLKAAGIKKFNRELADEIHKIQQADEQGRQWSQTHYWGGYTSYGSWDRLHEFSTTFETLEKHLQLHVSRFAKSLQWDMNPQDLQCDSLWVNVMPQGTTHSFHIHPLSVISGTYYVEVPPGAPGIQFEDPRHNFMMACPPRKASAPQETKPHYTHKSKAGEVVLFESWMKHQVPPNPSTKPRISVSFNYNWIRS